MKKRRGIKQQTSVKIKRKTLLRYGAASMVLIAIVGAGVFFYLNMGTSTQSTAKTMASDQGYYSSGQNAWSDNATWTKAHSWMNDNPGTNVNTGFVNVYGFITRTGDLRFGGSTVLTVYDTLWITGDLTMSEGASITVESTGVLIVEGSYISDGGAVNRNDGRVVVKEDLIASGGAAIENNNAFYVLGSTSSSGGATFNGVQNNPSNSNFSDESQLMANDYALYEFSNGNSTLPIELTYFKVKAAAKTVLVEWETSTEINNDFFTVERSADGRTFESIITINGAGNSQQSRIYSYTDPYPLEGVSYYRLKQTDFDGKYERFKTVAVSRQATNAADPTPVIHSVAPNPFDISFSVAYEVPTAGPVRIQLMDLNGTTITSEIIEAASGRNQYQFEQGGQLKSGIYLLMLTSDQHTSKTMRVVKR
ncbi:MAG: T9SS type A sorting domain-containing protein [Cyclobacteriaceae bacterium]